MGYELDIQDIDEDLDLAVLAAARQSRQVFSGDLLVSADGDERAQINPPIGGKVHSGAQRAASLWERLVLPSAFAPVTNITAGVDCHQRLVTTPRRWCCQRGKTTMNRNTNVNCLCSLLDAYEQTSDETARLRIRQVMYVHGIVDAVLSERIYLLPEASLASR